jgi:hypothetical protein
MWSYPNINPFIVNYRSQFNYSIGSIYISIITGMKEQIERKNFNPETKKGIDDNKKPSTPSHNYHYKSDLLVW